MEGKCDNCDNASKYTCPACYKSSCSLNCVRTHKTKYKCSGEVDPTRFVAKPDLMTAHSLDRDYNFLQRIGRDIAVDKNEARSRRVYKPRDSWRAGARVHSMAKGMSRSLQNKSRWDGKQFVWTVELIDMRGEKPTRQLVQVGDQTLVRDIPTVHTDKWDVKLRDFYCNELDLDSDITLQQAVKGKNILEFPTLVLRPRSFTKDTQNASESSGSDSDSSSSDSSSSDSDSSDSDSSDSDSDADSDADSSDGSENRNSNGGTTGGDDTNNAETSIALSAPEVATEIAPEKARVVDATGAGVDTAAETSSVTAAVIAHANSDSDGAVAAPADVTNQVDSVGMDADVK